MDVETSRNEISAKQDANEMRWFLAELVLAHTCKAWDNQVVHVNYVLVEASAPESAYQLALELGDQYTVEIVNDLKESVVISFLGVRELYDIGNELRTGLELFYTEQSFSASDDLTRWIVPKQQLRAFHK